MSAWLWVGFVLLVLFLLALDLGVFNRRVHVISGREALGWTAFWIALALLFNIGIYFLIKAGDEALREAGAFSAWQSQGLGFEFAYWLSHSRRLSRERVAVRIAPSTYRSFWLRSYVGVSLPKWGSTCFQHPV